MNRRESLKKLRTGNGFDLNQAANATNFSADFVADIESGKRAADGLLTAILVSGVGGSLDEFFGSGLPLGKSGLLKSDASKAKERPSSFRKNGTPGTDIRLELSDFVPELTNEMIQAWKSGELEQWLCNLTCNEWEKTLANCLGKMSLENAHFEARGIACQLVKLAANDKQKQIDALYLRGRQRWYENEHENASQDFEHALELLGESVTVRRAQILLYYARVLVKIRKLSTKEADNLLDEVELIAKRLNRQDLELLEMRARMIQLRFTHRRKEAIPLGREILKPDSEWLHSGMENIMTDIRVQLGISLRGENSEECRREAEGLYKHGMKEGRSLSRRGMCHYLAADLYIDRMLESKNKAAMERESAEHASKWTIEQEDHRKKALELSRQAVELLTDAGDHETLRKANYRAGFLQNPEIVLRVDGSEGIEAYIVQIEQFTNLFLGTPKFDKNKSYSPWNPRSNRLDTQQLTQLLESYFSAILIQESGTNKERVSVIWSDYISANTLLCIPWQVGDSLVIRVFGKFDESDFVDNVGWIRLANYQSHICRGMEAICEMSNPIAYENACTEAYSAILERLSTVDPMTEAEHPGLAHVENTVILAPTSSADWICPVEWLETDPDKNKQGKSLLNLVSGSVVFSPSETAPLPGTEISLSPSDLTVLATDQSLGELTITKYCKQNLNAPITGFDSDSPVELSFGTKSLFLVAHSDNNGVLKSAVDRLDFSCFDSVVLLCCSSGQYQVQNGPFVDGLSLKVRRQLGEKGIVVSSRTPVSIGEACRFANWLIRIDGSKSLAHATTEYLRLGQAKNINPYQVPWIAIS